MTDEQKKAYIESKGKVCPLCGADTDSVDNDWDDEGRYIVFRACMGCGASFTETHDIVSVELDEVEP